MPPTKLGEKLQVTCGFGLRVVSPTMDPASQANGHDGPGIPPFHEQEEIAVERGEVT